MNAKITVRSEYAPIKSLVKTGIKEIIVGRAIAIAIGAPIPLASRVTYGITASIPS